MSKKLIAVASATALALTGFVGVSANAAAQSISVAASTLVAPGTGSAADPYLVLVPELNELDTAANSALAVTLSGDAGDTYSVSTTGAVRLVQSEVLSASKDINVTTLGKSSFSGKLPAGKSVTFYAYSTSTTAGTIVGNLTRTGLSTSETFYVEGVAGVAHTLSAVAGVPAALADTKEATFSFKVSDVFGNAIEDFNAAGGTVVTVDASKATDAKATGTDTNGWDSSSKTYKVTLTSASDDPMVLNIDLGAATAADGFADAKDTYVTVINGAGSDQVAALQAKLANRVTKKRFNTLAKKWNAAFPSQAVKLKK
jgi:hypothetical protein